MILPRGDGMALGVIQACSAAGKLVIGDIADQNAIAKPAVLTSNVVNFSVTISKFVGMYRDDI